MKFLKKIILIFTAIALFLTGAVTAGNIMEKSRREHEMKVALEKAMELTIKNIVADPVYFAENNEQLIADVTQNFIVQLDSEIDELIIKVVDVDYITGLLDIEATPTMYINGEQIIGVKPYYQLKEILVRHGAKRK